MRASSPDVVSSYVVMSNMFSDPPDNVIMCPHCSGQLMPSPQPPSSGPRVRKHSASRLLTSCKSLLNRRSSESSVSPPRLGQRPGLYDGDVETSDSGAGNREPKTSSGGTRAKIRESLRSISKGKSKNKPRPQINITFDESFKKLDLRGAASSGSDMNGGESGSQMSSPTCYQTADSADTQASSGSGRRVSKVSLMISRWEAGVRPEDDHLLSPGDQPDTASSRLSCGSTTSSDASSAQNTSNHDQTVSSDPSSEGREPPEQKRERKLKEAAREIMTSEKTYVEVLRLISNDFKTFVENKINDTKKNIIPLPEFQKIFKNFPHLLMFNEELLQDFEDRIENWDTNPKIADVIKKKGPFLKLYKTYVDEFDNLRVHFSKCCESYKDFKTTLQEFESLPKCQNLKLTFFMLKPVQRVPQYKMLLENYFKYLPEESIDFEDTVDALKVVASVAEHCNDSLHSGVSHCWTISGLNYIFFF